MYHYFAVMMHRLARRDIQQAPSFADAATPGWWAVDEMTTRTSWCYISAEIATISQPRVLNIRTNNNAVLFSAGRNVIVSARAFGYDDKYGYIIPRWKLCAPFLEVLRYRTTGHMHHTICPSRASPCQWVVDHGTSEIGSPAFMPGTFQSVDSAQPNHI